jgi:predicted HTH transcriptional regulator
MLFFGNLLLGEKNILKNRELHIHFVAPENTPNILGANNENGGVNSDVNGGQKTVVRKSGQKKWSENLVKVFELIRNNPKITRKELSDSLQINPSAVQKHVEKLKTERIIIRVGSDKTGSWEIVKTVGQ